MRDKNTFKDAMSFKNAYANDYIEKVREKFTKINDTIIIIHFSSLIPEFVLLKRIWLNTGRKGTLGCLLHKSPKFYINVFFYLLASQLWGLLLNFNWLVH